LVDIQYYSAIGTPAQPPLTFPVVSASHVTAISGTGLVHTAPAHGSEDYGVFNKLDIFKGKEIPTLVDDDGLFTEGIRDVWGPEAAEVLVGKEVLYGGNKAVLKLLEEHGNLVSASTFKHRYPYDWKTDKPVIVRATAQWFANLERIKEQALKALQDVQFYPPSCELTESLSRLVY
jgi:isoleucyl-tRNA synthetase